MANAAAPVPKSAATVKLPRPKAIKSADEIVRRQSSADQLSEKVIMQGFDRSGNTSLRAFGRVLRDEPHKNIYPIKLFLVRNKVRDKDVKEWFAIRYAQATGGRNHGARYEVRTYKGEGGKRYVDYLLLETMSEEELVMFTMRFGTVTNDKVIRNGKLRRPRLNKDQRKRLDGVLDDFYLEIERERAAIANGNLVIVD